MAKDQHDPAKEAHDQEWAFLHEIRLNPQISSMGWYERALILGVDAARNFLKDKPVQAPTLELISEVHKTVYAKCFVWAGEFRQPGFGFVQAEKSRNADIQGSEFNKIREHLQSAAAECGAALKSAEGVQDKAAALAEYHQNFESIRPFVLGNGIVGRLLLDEQARQELGAKQPLQIDRDKAGYLGALKLADAGVRTTELRDKILAAANASPVLERADKEMRQAEAEAKKLLEAERQESLRLLKADLTAEPVQKNQDLQKLQEGRRQTTELAQAKRREKDLAHEY